MQQSVTHWIGNMKINKPLNILTINNAIYYPIYEFNGKYYIKESGDIVYTTVYKRELKTQINKDGYYYNNLIFNGVQAKRFYHRLIANNLLLRKDNRDIINHKNSNRKDNRIKNLEWVYRYENTHHGMKISNYKHDNNTHYRLLQDSEIKDIYTSTLSESDLIKKYPKLTRGMCHDIKYDLVYKDITHDLKVGRSKYFTKVKKIDSINDSVIYNLWLNEYVTNNKSLNTLYKETGLSPGTLKRRFLLLHLPLKEIGRYGKIKIQWK